ncbi:MAG: sigma-70 family RNA polymerase sigma factor [Chloroflexota bacterium]
MALLDAARRMNGDALAEIFDLYSPAIYKYVLHLCNDAMLADQIVGDVFAKLLDHLSAGNGPGTNLPSYLYQTAYHIIIDEARYWHGRTSLEAVDFLRYDGYSAYTNLENQILFETISQAILNDLTAYQRHVIILRFLEGFSLRETAAILGKSVNIVKAAQNRAIVTLRQALGHRVIATHATTQGTGNYASP